MFPISIQLVWINLLLVFSVKLYHYTKFLYYEISNFDNLISRLAKSNNVEELFSYEDLKLYRSVKNRIQVCLKFIKLVSLLSTYLLYIVTYSV